ncbi:DUF763 domain-containing protein [archaeon SCG-AAA382B04]|nr:DUF763 domain-containing protein [archaeon SCG-AAA382B04]
MKRSGTTDLPLHGGSCPPWLFDKMERLVGEISELIIYEYSPEEFIKRLADPVFFQSLGCLVGFDWHSSGLSTTLTGALKEALDPELHGVEVAGGKGSSSRKTPQEIRKSDLLSSSEKTFFVDASKLSAKVDNNCVQDSFNLYHHCFIFSENGDWIVIQQGMNSETARRYHWIGEEVEEFVEEPHFGICCDVRKDTLDLTSKNSAETRQISLDLVNDDSSHLKKYLLPEKTQSTLSNFNDALELPKRHSIRKMDFSKQVLDNLDKAYERQPKDFEELVSVDGVGPKSIRALALVSDLVFGADLATDDPATYSFAHGGKDGVPYPVDEEKYEESISFLGKAISEAKIGEEDKKRALKRLKSYLNQE